MIESKIQIIFVHQILTIFEVETAPKKYI